MTGTSRRPENGESLNGFIARVAAAEFLPNTLEITALGGAMWSHRPELSRERGEMAGVASFLRTDPDLLAGMVYQLDPERPGRRMFYGSSIDKRFLVHNERRFSPASISENETHLAVWDLQPFPFCERSGQLLTARCPDPNCGRIQRWYHSNGIGLCDICGEPLANATSATVPSEDLPDLRTALGLVHPDADRRSASADELPDRLRHIPGGNLLDLLVAVAGVHSPDLRCPSMKRALRSNADPLAICAAVAAAWRILREWPTAFQRLASERIATRPGRFGDGNKGATKDMLDLDDSPATPPVLVKIVADLRNFITEHGKRYGIGTNPASRSMPFMTRDLAAARRRGDLSTIFALVKGEPQPLLDLSELTKLTRSLAFSSTMTDAALRLGISVDGVCQLVALGRLDESSARTLRRKGDEPRVTNASVDDVLSKLEEGSETASCFDVDEAGIPLSTIMRSIGGGHKPWGAIVTSLLDGRFRYRIKPGKNPIVRRIVVEPAMMRWSRSIDRSPPDGTATFSAMSRSDAMSVLNLHERHANVLDRWRPSATCRTRIPTEPLLEMAAELISLGEMTARMGCSAIEADRLLQEHHIEREGPWCKRREVEIAFFAAPIEGNGMRVGADDRDVAEARSNSLG